MSGVISRLERSSGHTTTIVTRYRDGIRVVCREYGNAESWSQYVVIPRSLILQKLRERRAIGVTWHTLRYIAMEIAQCAPVGCGGPGQPFAREPYRMRSSRRWIVIYQSGGWDV